MIHKAPDFNRDFNELCVTINRLDEFIIGAEEIISRKPEVGRPTAQPYIFALKQQALPGNPQAVLYYFYTTEQVVFWRLRVDGRQPPIIAL